MKIALITARGGSKGLPRKNILPLNGIPLIGWTIKAALDVTQIDRVFVSTEDSEIAKVSQELGAEVIPRPLELASDTASSEVVIEHAIEYLTKESISFDTFILLQPTSPLRTADHINSAITIYDDKNANVVLSVFEPSHTPIKAYIETGKGEITGLFSPEAPYSRRQDLPKAFQPNGAIYVFNVNKFLEEKKFPKERVFPFVMTEQESADIDTQEDLHNVEKSIKRIKNDKSSN
jgi:CMP-N-acetylneuraminic acid synthetase